MPLCLFALLVLQATAQQPEAGAEPATTPTPSPKVEPTPLPAVLSTSDLALNVAQVVATVTDGEYERARRRAEELIAGLPALTSPPRPQDLATLWQSLGAIGVYAGQDALIAHSFAQACAMAPGWFEERLGPLAQTQWQSACQQVVGQATIEATPLPAKAKVWIDGAAADQGLAFVAPGRHLVQVITQDHPVYAVMVEVAGGQRATVDPGLPVRTPHERQRLALLGGSMGLAFVGAGVSGVLAAGHHRDWVEGERNCQEAKTCTVETSETVLADRDAFRRETALAVASGVLGLGLGVGFLLTW